MAYYYEGDQDGIDQWDGHTLVVEREGYEVEHPDDLWHWSVDHPATCPETEAYLGRVAHECVFSMADPCFEGGESGSALDYDAWPPELPKVDGARCALGTRLDVYRHWELGDEVDLWWLVGPVLDPGADTPPIPRSV